MVWTFNIFGGQCETRLAKWWQRGWRCIGNFCLKWRQMGNVIKWEMTSNGKWHQMGIDIKWENASNGNHARDGKVIFQLLLAIKKLWTQRKTCTCRTIFLNRRKQLRKLKSCRIPYLSNYVNTAQSVSWDSPFQKKVVFSRSRIFPSSSLRVMIDIHIEGFSSALSKIGGVSSAPERWLAFN